MSPGPPTFARFVSSIGRLSVLSVGAAVVACAGASVAHGQTASCPGADVAFSAMAPAQAEVSVVCLSNAARVAAGLETLRSHPQLRTAARRHADDMHARGYFDHVAPAPAPHGPTLLDRVNASGYPLRTAGENLASGHPTPRRATVGWLTSPGHCRNLLDPAFDEVGVGRAADGPIWVQVLGTRGTPSSAGPFPGCDSGDPPSIASVVGGPPSDEDSTESFRDSRVKIASVKRSGSRWKIRIRGSRAAGVKATVRTYGALRKCVTAPGKRKGCSTVPGSRRATVRVKLKSNRTVRIKRRAGDAFVRVSHPSFEQDGERFAAETVTRKLPR
ncbi:MAG: CAP domain-containing protein [Patulibacter sp.]|nr:CAP domain-containing protein [Patulibacter sp.]